ncbi:MAG: D-2-hydroxyacid dehydrogenase [Dehalococcoidales bacterium]|nr:D-2-hydroxyacid dehydrogenase [Dehalococcoidales bacterium]
MDEKNGGRSTARKKVLVIGPPDEPFWAGLDPVRERAEVVIAEDEAVLVREVAAAEVVFIWTPSSVLESLWPRAQALRWVHVAWAGVDAVLFPELVASDVLLSRSPGVYGDALAEYALAAMLHFAKRIPELETYQRQRTWHKITPAGLRGQTLGIIGLGDVGLAVAAKAKALGMRVVGLRRAAGEVPPGVDEVLPSSRLDELLAGADYLVLSAPLTPRTRGLIGEREFALMKPGVVFVNIARGGIVDEEALLRALVAGRLGGAAFDVFAEEPLPPESPLYDAPNLLISSHTVDNVPGWEERAIVLFVANFQRYVAGGLPANLVNKQRGY